MAKGSDSGKSPKPAGKVSQQKTTKPQKAVETEKPDPPKKVQPEKPEKAEPAKPKKAALAEPAAPDTTNASANSNASAMPSGNASASAGSSANGNSSSQANSAPQSEHDSLGKGNSARHKNTHAVAAEQSNAPSSAVFTGPAVRKSVKASGTSTTRDDARPRAPDADEAPGGDSPSPAVPSPCSPPASSLTTASVGGVGGLRNAHAVLPTAPDLSGTAAILVAQRDIGPNVSTRSAETTASPD